MIYLVPGINSLYFFVNFILVSIPPFPTYIFFRPSLFLFLFTIFLIHLPFSFTLGLKPTFSQILSLVVSLFPSGLPFRIFSSELLGFCFQFLN